MSANNLTDNVEESIEYNTGNFTELNQEITSANDNINIAKDHRYIAGEEKINFTKSISINGFNNTLDLGNEGEVFSVNDNVSVEFNNLTFKNFNNNSFKIYENSTFNLTFINCVFSLNETLYEQDTLINNPDFVLTKTCEVTEEIAQLAKKIVGKSTGITAAKKLAKWVNSHISHETEADFYQSPSETLHRKRGNCCCHSELFAQMCEAIGLTKNHKICLVHVGYPKFKKRHFFITFDNIVVDTDGNFKNPWGHGKFSGRDVFRMTLYPYLPVARAY